MEDPASREKFVHALAAQPFVVIPSLAWADEDSPST